MRLMTTKGALGFPAGAPLVRGRRSAAAQVQAFGSRDEGQSEAKHSPLPAGQPTEVLLRATSVGLLGERHAMLSCRHVILTVDDLYIPVLHDQPPPPQPRSGLQLRDERCVC